MKGKIAARILLLPALAGFAALFALNFSVIALALVSVSAGILCAPLGALYSFGIVKMISDLSPSALTAAGFFFLFFGCFLSLAELKLAPFCMRCFYRYCSRFMGKRWRRVYSNFNINKFLIAALVLSVLSFGAVYAAQVRSVQNGFESTVIRERLEFGDAKYIYVSTSGLDFEIKHYDGQGILLDYVNDSRIITEEADVNYLRLTQDDSFAISLFARDQFDYKMTLWLPENDYREFYLDSGSGDIALFGTAAGYTEIHTRSGNIKIIDADKQIDAAAISGNIFCDYLEFKHIGNYETRSGDIAITIPEDSGVKLEYRTDEGALLGDLMGQPEDFIGSIDISKTAYSQSENSGELYVTTKNGNLTLSKAETRKETA